MKTKRLFYIGIMTITISLFPTLLFGQSIFDYEGITYRVIKDADEASTFGTVAVTAKDDGFYEGKITIPNGVKHSEDSYADSYKVVSIDDFAFKGNVTLEEVQLPISIESIGEGAFEGCSKLNHVEIPEGSALSRLGESVFAYSGLESIVFPKGIIELPRFTFRECRRLQQVTLPKSLTKIGVSAFIFCQSLQSIDLPRQLRSIDICAFYGTGLRKVVLPDKVVAISQMAFSGCFDLEEVRLSPYTTSIAAGAFSGCGHLSIVGPENIDSIDNGAFSLCWDIPEQYQTPDYKSMLETMGIERMQESINDSKNSSWK